MCHFPDRAGMPLICDLMYSALDIAAQRIEPPRACALCALAFEQVRPHSTTRATA